MKRKKIFLGLVLFAMVMSITACSMSKDDTSETQIMQPESISAEKENDGQEKAGSHDIQIGVEREDENKGTEVQQSEKQELQQPERQQVQNEADADLEERLAQYREERESMTNVAMGNGVSGYGAPNAENFGFQADTADYMQNFDSRELNKAYETTKKYVTETLKISVEKNVYFRNKEEQFDFYKSKGINGWVADPNGTNTAGWGLSLTTMDMAKLGLLYLNKGFLYNRQIVSEKWVSESTQVQSVWETRNLKYGYLWWIIDEKDCFFAALGDGGNTIYVNTKDKIVVAISSLFVPRVKDRVDFIKNDIEPIFKFN